MAISCDFTWRGIVVKNAYIRVDKIFGSKRPELPIPDAPNEPKWYAAVGVYADSGQNIPLLIVDVSIPFVTDESPYPGLYSALKTMPEFSGAVDC